MGDPLRTDEARLEPITIRRMAISESATRAYRWATAAGALTLFIWCAARPDVWRFVGACAFTVFVHVPSWIAERKRR